MSHMLLSCQSLTGPRVKDKCKQRPGQLALAPQTKSSLMDFQIFFGLWFCSWDVGCSLDCEGKSLQGVGNPKARPEGLGLKKLPASDLFS